MKLTQQEKRTRILIAIGWSLVKVYQWNESNPSIRLPKQFHVDKYGVIHNAPDVFGDLNAMHEAEQRLNQDDPKEANQPPLWCIYQHWLRWVAVNNAILTLGHREMDRRTTIGAAAAQRAEAFGLTLNLWEAGE